MIRNDYIVVLNYNYNLSTFIIFENGQNSLDVILHILVYFP